MSNDKEYKKRYYQENKEKLKAYQRERYQRMKEMKEEKEANDAKDAAVETKGNNIGNVGMGNNGLATGTFFSISSPNVISSNDPKTIISKLNSWIYSCANMNASSVASQSLRLYATMDGSDGDSIENKFLHKNRMVSASEFNYIKKESSVKSLARVRTAEGAVEIVEHPVLDLLENMNSFNNNFESFELTSLYLDMLGDSYWWVRTDSDGLPYEIWVLMAQYVKILPAKTMNKFIKGYVYGTNPDDMVKFSPSELIHFKTPNPNSMYYGKGAAEAVLGAINRMDMMDASESARLKNMGRPDFIVNYKGQLDQEEIKKIERMWRNAFGGPGKDGKIKVMDTNFDIKELGFSPRDMEYLNGRTWSLKEIASAFNVPYSMLDSSDAKKATSEIAERSYAKLAILPRISRIAEKLTEKLLPFYDNSGRMFFMYNDPVPADRKLLLEEGVNYVNAGIISVNEARLRLGMEPLDGEEYDKPRQGNGNAVAVSENTPTNDEDE